MFDSGCPRCRPAGTEKAYRRPRIGQDDEYAPIILADGGGDPEEPPGGPELGTDRNESPETPVGNTISFEGEEPTIAYGEDERPLGEVLKELDENLATLNGKFTRIVQEQRDRIERLEETMQAHKFAIQELQAGMEALAEEHDKDVEYQFEL